MDYVKLMQAQLAIMQALFASAEKENRDFDEGEQKKYNDAKAEFERLKGLKDRAESLKNMAAAIPDPDPAPQAHEPASTASGKTVNAKAGKDLKTEKPYDHMGNMLVDVAKAKMGNGEANERLVNASLNTETGADGGFIVPPDFIGGMLEQAVSLSQLYSRVNELQILGNNANIPAVDETSRADGSRFGGIAVYWVKEGGLGTYTQPKFRNLDLKLSKLMGLVSVTDEMLEDSMLLDSWVQSAFPAEMAFALDQAVYNGDGNGKPLGILNSSALVTVAAEGGQAAGTIVYENVIKMWARMPASRMARAAWYVTQQALEQLPLMNLSVGTGGAPVFLPVGGASEAPFGTLLGRPVIPIEQATALGQVGDILLGDLSDYIAITKGGLKTASSIHVDFDKDKTSFRFVRRVNGAPYTRTKLQSKSSGTFYTSPYITLAART